MSWDYAAFTANPAARGARTSWYRIGSGGDPNWLIRMRYQLGARHRRSGTLRKTHSGTVQRSLDWNPAYPGLPLTHPYPLVDFALTVGRSPHAHSSP